MITGAPALLGITPLSLLYTPRFFAYAFVALT
jgi:hypothetical protein